MINQGMVQSERSKRSFVTVQVSTSSRFSSCRLQDKYLPPATCNLEPATWNPNNQVLAELAFALKGVRDFLEIHLL
jgi:hypothetical protein